MSDSSLTIDTATQEAFRLLQAGQTVEAEELMLCTVQDAAVRHGKDSLAYAMVQNALGTVLLNVGQLDRAFEAFRAAVAGPEPQEEQAHRDRLTYLTNLGTALAYNDQLDEAEQVLRQALDGRRAVYGTENAGYAFGLEPLADVLLKNGKVGEAREVIEQAVANFGNNGHLRVTSALALRAEIIKAGGENQSAFDDLNELPDEVVEAVGNAVIGRVGQTDPVLVRQVLADLVPLVEERLGDGHPLLLNVLATVANLERDLGADGDADVRQQAIRTVIAVHDQQGRQEEALQAVLGLALALSDTGQQDEALASYRDAVSRAERLDQSALQAQVRRNFGLFLADLKNRQEAEEQLRQAVASATRAGDITLLGRCQVAMGIFLQHGGQQDEARQQLSRALTLMDPAHPDAVCARSHLGALESGQACGCGDQGKALAEAFKEFVLARLPTDLLNRLDVEPKDGQFGIQVQLKREPTQEELRRLDLILNHALEAFQAKLLAIRH